MLGRNLLIVSVLALSGGLAAGAWWLIQTPPVAASKGEPISLPPVETPRDTAPAEPSDRAKVTLEDDPGPAAAAATTVVFPVEFDLELVASAVKPSGEGVAPMGSDSTARLAGSVNDVGGAGVRAEVTFVAGANSGRLLHGDRDGRFGANDLYPGLSILRITAPGTPGAMREVLLRKDRESLLNIGFGRPAQFRGLVVDSAGAPIAGARVTVDGQETISDDVGEFVFGAVAGGDTFATAEKPGFASYWEKLTIVAGQIVEKGRVTFVLRRPARLEITIEDRLNVDGEALVFLLPDPLNSARDFPWYRVSPARVYPGGTVTVEDLPAKRVSLRLFHAGALAKPLTRSVTLVEGETEHVTLHLEPAPVLLGVVTQDGRPVSGAAVVLEAPERSAAMLSVLGESNYLDLEREILTDFPPAVQRVKTNVAGEFLLSASENVTKVRYLHATSPDGRNTAWKVLRGGETRVDLALEAAQGEGRLVVEMENRTQGLPVQVTVNGAPREPRVLPAGEDLDVEGLPPGTWKLTARWNGEPIVTSMPVEIHDETTIEIVLPEGAIVGQDEDTRRRSGK